MQVERKENICRKREILGGKEAEKLIASGTLGLFPVTWHMQRMQADAKWAMRPNLF